jgi:hypothetical protein
MWYKQRNLRVEEGINEGVTLVPRPEMLRKYQVQRTWVQSLPDQGDS